MRAALVLALIIAPLGVAFAGDLGGSKTSMRRQHAIARRNAYAFLATSEQVREAVQSYWLERLETNADLTMAGVSFPYARPEVNRFLERLAAQYHAATGQLLVVTSLTRPLSQQPRNASPLSVHPTGMAVDLRIPTNAKGRKWLERALIELEAKGLIDATRERSPKHYHVAVFATTGESFADRRGVSDSSRAAAFMAMASTTVVASLEPANPNEPTEDAADATEASAPPRTPVMPFLSIFGLTGIAIAATGLARRKKALTEPTSSPSAAA